MTEAELITLLAHPGNFNCPEEQITMLRRRKIGNQTQRIYLIQENKFSLITNENDSEILGIEPCATPPAPTTERSNHIFIDDGVVTHLTFAELLAMQEERRRPGAVIVVRDLQGEVTKTIERLGGEDAEMAFQCLVELEDWIQDILFSNIYGGLPEGHREVVLTVEDEEDFLDSIVTLQINGEAKYHISLENLTSED